jgi:cell division protein ZapD
MPAKKTFIYEQPLNERVRIMLRIEALIHKLDYFASLNSDTASYQAILTVLEITSLVERGDLKKEVMKELERQQKVMNGLISHQGVDKSRLELTISRLKKALNNIHGMDGKLGEHLKKIDFLLTIKQRSAIPGGSCDFDLPQLRDWLNRDYKLRLQDLERWADPYQKLYDVLELALNIIRDSAHAENILANKGFYQESLDTSQPNQLIRIEIPRELGIFPEISAGKHRYTIRFLESPQTVDKIPVQFKQDIEFKLYRCTL